MTTTIELASAEELADVLGVPPSVIERLAEEHHIPSLEVPARVLMFDVGEVLILIDRKRAEKRNGQAK